MGCQSRRDVAVSAPHLSLAAMRGAIRRQRAAKQPGDGLLYKLPSDSGGAGASIGSGQGNADLSAACSVEVSATGWLLSTKQVLDLHVSG